LEYALWTKLSGWFRCKFAVILSLIGWNQNKRTKTEIGELILVVKM